MIHNTCRPCLLCHTNEGGWFAKRRGAIDTQLRRCRQQTALFGTTFTSQTSDLRGSQIV